MRKPWKNTRHVKGYKTGSFYYCYFCCIHTWPQILTATKKNRPADYLKISGLKKCIYKLGIVLIKLGIVVNDRCLTKPCVQISLGSYHMVTKLYIFSPSEFNTERADLLR